MSNASLDEAQSGRFFFESARTTEQSAIMKLMLSRSSDAASDLVKTMNTGLFEGPTAQRSTSKWRAQANPRF
jgi:hypothetical protein